MTENLDAPLAAASAPAMSGVRTAVKTKQDMPKYCFVRRNKIWVRLKRENGEWKNTPTPFTPDQVDEARRYVNAALRRIEVKAESADLGELTIQTYGERWVKEREKRDISSAQDDERRLRLHVFPLVGHFKLEDFRPRNARDFVRSLISLKKADKEGKLTNEKKHAPRSVHHCYNLLHNIFESAVIDELVSSNPVKVEPHELPAKVDKDPEWRGQATYQREEIVRLLTEPIIPPERRMMYALKALAGQRHGEAASNRWRHIDSTKEPLHQLSVVTSWDSRRQKIKSTKTEQVRYAPIHPTLARMLESWRKMWPSIYGREPTPDDFIVPTRTFRCVAAKDAGEAMKRDFTALGIRIEAGEHRDRGGHDLRAWFKTQAIEDGADSMLLQHITHAPPKDVDSRYKRFTWGAYCREVSKLQVEILDGDILKPVTQSLHREAMVRGRYEKLVTPKGLEPFNYAHLGDDKQSNYADSGASRYADERSLARTVTAVTRAKRLFAELKYALRDNDVSRAELIVKRLQSKGYVRELAVE